MAITPLTLGTPGSAVSDQVTFSTIWLNGVGDCKPGGGLINVAETRDTGNSSGVGILRTGLLMSYYAAGKDYANWILGVTTGALTGAGTSITISAAGAAELVRKGGATGTFVLTGPEAVAGTTRQVTVTYSAVDTTTGVVTITAIGVNQVENVRMNIASTGGNLQLNVSTAAGVRVTTANIAWSATDATYLASINSALDTSTGVVGGIVATAISAVDTNLGFKLTYSGTGYAGKSFGPASVVVFPTSTTSSMTESVTAAVQGAFIAGSVVSDANYSLPTTAISVPPDNSNMSLVTTTYADWALIPMAGAVNTAALLDFPTDTSLRLWVEQQMSSLAGNKFTFVPQ